MSIYDYSVPAPNGEEISLRNFEGKVILIVNTATGCGFTPHYKPIEQVDKNVYLERYNRRDYEARQKLYDLINSERNTLEDTFRNYV